MKTFLIIALATVAIAATTFTAEVRPPCCKCGSSGGCWCKVCTCVRK